MADAEKTPTETPHFETDTVQADRAREQGLGLGARELQAQRDPGGIRTPSVDDGEDQTDSDAGGADEHNSANVAP